MNPPVQRELITVVDVAVLLGCSKSKVRRMVEMQKMPLPIKLGKLVRWQRSKLQQWIVDGCPAQEESK